MLIERERILGLLLLTPFPRLQGIENQKFKEQVQLHHRTMKIERERFHQSEHHKTSGLIETLFKTSEL